MAVEDGFYQQALRRVCRIMRWLAAASAVAAAVWQGWLAGIALLLGAAGAYLNFSWLHQMVSALGP